MSGLIVVMLLYDRMSRLSRLVLLASAAVVGSAVAWAAFAMVAAGKLALPGLYVVNVTIGFCASIGGSLPGALFSCSMGGPRHSATMANVLDLGAISLSAYAAYTAGDFVDRKEFQLYWLQFAVFFTGGGVAVTAFAFFDWREAKKAADVAPRAPEPQVRS